MRAEAFTAARLERQLEDQTRSFLRDHTVNRYDEGSRTMYLSKIFDWFSEDFGTRTNAVLDFVAGRLPEATARAVRAGGVKVELLDYDWTLNGK